MNRNRSSGHRDPAANAGWHNGSTSEELTEIRQAGPEKILAAAIDLEVADYVNNLANIVV